VEPLSSRREFLVQLGGMWMAAYLPLMLSTGERARAAAATGAPFTTLTPGEARTLEAVAAQILPSDELPGAREAGMAYFADAALATFFADQLPGLRTGLAELDRQAQATGAADFAALDDTGQQALVKQLEPTPLFQGIWLLTVMGTFAEPSYGGNRDGAGGRLLDIARAPSYQPPFGYYDAHAGAGE
jgi:gluconate 2-dehydrogenase gamma chain